MKVPKRIIYQMKLELERKKKRLKHLEGQIKILEQTISKMEPIDIKE